MSGIVIALCEGNGDGGGLGDGGCGRCVLLRRKTVNVSAAVKRSYVCAHIFGSTAVKHQWKVHRDDTRVVSLGLV